MLQQRHEDVQPRFTARPQLEDEHVGPAAQEFSRETLTPPSGSASDVGAVPQLQASQISPNSRSEIRLADPTEEVVRSWLDYVEIRRPRNWNGATTLLAAGIAIPLFYQLYLYSQFVTHPWPGMRPQWFNLLLLACTQTVPAGLLAMMSLLRRRQEQTEIESALPETPTVFWIAPLLDALAVGSRKSRDAARRLLPRLIVQLRPSHEDLLSDRQWEILGERLRTNAPSDCELNLAILKMLRRGCGVALLESAEAAAASAAWTPAQRRVRREARLCLAEVAVQTPASEAGGPVGPQFGNDVDREVAGGQESAVQQPGTVSPELAGLLRDLEQERQNHAQPGMRLAYLIASYLILAPGAAFLAARSFAEGGWAAGLLWASGAVGATQLYRFVLSPRQSEKLQKLAHSADPAAVGMLAEALEWPDALVQSVAATALTRLLPQLRASDASRLNSRQRASLYGRLSMKYVGRDGGLVSAILLALQQVGDEFAIPYVERLARSHAISWRQRRIRQEAEECLPFLRQSASQLRASQTLLRASAASAAGPETLLRAAEGATVAGRGDQLLRPDFVAEA